MGLLQELADGRAEVAVRLDGGVISKGKRQDVPRKKEMDYFMDHQFRMIMCTQLEALKFKQWKPT